MLGKTKVMTVDLKKLLYFHDAARVWGSYAAIPSIIRKIFARQAGSYKRGRHGKVVMVDLWLFTVNTDGSACWFAIVIRLQ